MKYDEIKAAWNAQADDGNRWHSLSEAEKIEWAAIHAAAKERAARQAAQAEVVDLKERIARAGVEQRRAVRDAMLAEREACAEACDDVDEPAYYGYVNPNCFDDGRRACAAAIRARP